MNQFATAQALAKTPGSSVLNAWRAGHGPEATRTGTITNGNVTTTNLTMQELANLIGGGGGAQNGPAVSRESALRVSTVYACVGLIAGAISTLALPIYERTATGRAVAEHPYFWMLNEEPNPEMSAAVFWEYMVTARMFYGDAFAEIVRGSYRSSEVKGLRAHHPGRVQPYRDNEGGIWYKITPEIGSPYVLSPADILHIPSLGFDGLRSPSPITYAARQAISTSISTAEFNSNFFVNGARPDFALQTDGTLTQDQADLLRATWMTRHGGASNAHLPAVLTGGLKVQQLTMSAHDSQILATSAWNLEEICRVLGVPPFMVGSTEKSTSWGTGQENMGRGFVKYTLLRDLKKIAQEVNRKFWPSRAKYFVEHDVTGIERSDLKTENDALRVASGRAGEDAWMTVNEIRHMKLLPPVEGGDVLRKASDAVAAAKPEPAPKA